MKILLTGGFLGSGKTTIIKEFIQGLTKSDETCAVIENEIGKDGIDDKTLQESGVSITPLFGGCVCCQITGSLINAFNTIAESFHPDWIIVELTGLALLKNLRNSIRQSEFHEVPIYTATVVDVSRWKSLIGPLKTIFEGQLEDADLVFLNKTRGAQIDPEITNYITAITGNQRFICPDNTNGNFLQLWQQVMESLKGVTQDV